MSRPRFKKLAVLGLGLLGGSVALAARRRGLAAAVWAWGKNPARLKAAKQKGIVNWASVDLAEACAGADLIVLCTPFTLFEGLLAKVSKLAPSGCLVTDVGSVKGAWAGRWAKAARPLQYVPAHPMAGSEHTGWEHANPRLFDGAPCLLTPLSSTSKTALKRVSAFWAALGCRLHTLSPLRHDQLIGRFSHLTHAMAFALARTASRGLKDSEFLMAGPSYRGNARIAASDAGLWTDIFEYNRGVLVRELDAAISELRRIKALRGAALRRYLHAISQAERRRRA